MLNKELLLPTVNDTGVLRAIFDRLVDIHYDYIICFVAIDSKIDDVDAFLTIDTVGITDANGNELSCEIDTRSIEVLGVTYNTVTLIEELLYPPSFPITVTLLSTDTAIVQFRVQETLNDPKGQAVSEIIEGSIKISEAPRGFGVLFY